MKRFPCIESTVDVSVKYDDFVLYVRVWINSEAFPPPIRKDVQEDIMTFFREKQGKVRDTELWQFLVGIPDINAAQVKYGNNVGGIVYFVPFEDQQ